MVNIQENILLSPYTTFKIGGVAKYFVEAVNKKDLVEAIKWASKQGEDIFIMGGGSNLLISDKGLSGLVIFLKDADIEIQDTSARCFAGSILMHLVETARDSALKGVENLAGVPGTVGGAVRGNAGAFGTEIKDVAREVIAIHRKTLEEKTFSTEECTFSYRTSFFKQNPEWVVAEVIIDLKPGDTSELRIIIEDTLAKRNEKQDQDIKSAGSFFINPVIEDADLLREFEKEANTKSRGGKVPAGWIIDKAGLRGKRIGGAQVSKQHPNYILNVNRATAEDVITLASYIKQQVRDQLNVELQREVQYVGF